METGLLSQAPPKADRDPLVKDLGQNGGLWAPVEKFAIPVAMLVSLIAFVRYAAYASRRLWFDEVYTATVALQPEWIDVWNAFRTAVDFQPPLFSYTTRISWMLFGHNELALRMPQLLGVIVFAWCLLFFIGKRLGYAFGLSAMILALVTDLEFYSGHARPYGMLLAACGLAMLAWRNAVENPKRRVALPLFAASLSAIVATHAYALIAVAMFALAEGVRWFVTRRPDWKLWFCFLPPALPLSLYFFPLHVVKSGGGGVGPSKWVHWNSVPTFYWFFFHDRLPLLFLIGVLFVGLALLRKGAKPRINGLPVHEIALAVALAVSPVFCVAMAMVVTNYYWAQYSIYAIGGIVVLVIVLLDAVGPSRRITSLMLLAVSFILFGLDQLYVKFDRNAMQQRDAELEIPFNRLPAGAPLVIASGLSLLPADVYSSDTDLARTYYLMDSEAANKYTGCTFFEFGPPFTSYHHFRTHLVAYNDFLKTHRKFFVYGSYSYHDDWQIRKLIDDGAKIVKMGKYAGESADNYLLQVELP